MILTDEFGFVFEFQLFCEVRGPRSAAVMLKVDVGVYQNLESGVPETRASYEIFTVQLVAFEVEVKKPRA